MTRRGRLLSLVAPGSPWWGLHINAHVFVAVLVVTHR